MVQSMTGYSRSEMKNGEMECVIETRSVNNRFLDISVRLPRKLMEIELKIKKKTKEKFSRGSVEINISFNNEKKETNLTANLEIANVYKKILEELRTSLDMKQEIDLKDLLQFREIIKYEPPEENVDELWEMIEKNLDVALKKLQETRLLEGTVLLEDILSRIKSILEKVEYIKDQQPMILENYKKKLAERLSKLLEGQKIDEVRLLQEAAILADRSDISEEIVRLESHLKQFVILTKGHEAVGRQLEFLNQEMLREANTITSKANDYKVSQLVVQIKAELEKIREQIQNIE
ncbi:MAG TPA: YicC/YloC family endoribonuclease [Nitrospinota bacterium]|nr:YicC/YloC family endoribonuclease [Nitrospinota bacterium]